MVLRRYVAVIGVVVLLVGLSELILPAQVLAVTRSIMRPVILRVIGAVELVLGALMIAAAVKRVVRLRAFVLVLGIWLVIASIFVLAAPGFVIDLTYAILFYRPHGFQSVVLWASGLLRIVLGGALIWAGLKPPPPAEGVAMEHQ